MLKSFIQSISPIFVALSGTRSDLLVMIRRNCQPENIDPTIQLIREVINEDVAYQKSPLDLRNQRIYAVKVVNPNHMDLQAVVSNLTRIVWSQWSS